GVELHPLSQCERPLEPARVPRLGRDRIDLPARAPPRLGVADLVAARAAMGHRRDPERRPRRGRMVPDRDVRRDRRGLPRARLRLPPHLRRRRARPRDALTLVTQFARVFFIGGLISYRALFNWIRPYHYIPTMLG